MGNSIIALSAVVFEIVFINTDLKIFVKKTYIDGRTKTIRSHQSLVFATYFNIHIHDNQYISKLISAKSMFIL